MMIVDYRCDECGTVDERSVASPPPTTATCTACGSPARRVYGGYAVPGRARRAAADRLERERALRPATRGTAVEHHHDHGHHHGHDHGHHHGHDHDHHHGPEQGTGH